MSQFQEAVAVPDRDKPTRLKSIKISGFRSLRDVELSDFGDANILIGANGSGKSNFMRFFEMLSWMLKSGSLGDFVARHGGADDQLHGGSRVRPAMQAEITLETGSGRNGYRSSLPVQLLTGLILPRAFRCQRGTIGPPRHHGPN